MVSKEQISRLLGVEEKVLRDKKIDDETPGISPQRKSSKGSPNKFVDDYQNSKTYGMYFHGSRSGSGGKGLVYDDLQRK